jgi:hypothetical protein
MIAIHRLQQRRLTIISLYKFAPPAVMPSEVNWHPWTGIIESAEQPKPQAQLPLQMAADCADAEERTKAFLGEVYTKERWYLDAYLEVRERI